jgi:hypothetical protein
MKNQYKQRQRQIEKSIKGDHIQNQNYFLDLMISQKKRKKKENKPRLVLKNGQLNIKRLFNNGVPFSWEDNPL